MNNFFKDKKAIYIKNQGFTLIELMVVIVIIGILVTMGIFAFQSSQKKSRDARRKEDLSQISKALEMYNNDHGAYPPASADGLIKGCGIGFTEPCDWTTTFGNDSTVTYMVKLPKDPTSTWNYMYKEATKGYYLYARLENLEDSSFPESGPIEYTDVYCASGVYCNYVLTSSNTTQPIGISVP